MSREDVSRRARRRRFASFVVRRRHGVSSESRRRRDWYRVGTHALSYNSKDPITRDGLMDASERRP